MWYWKHWDKGKKVSNKKKVEKRDLTMVSESKPVRVPLYFIIVAND